jgi:hypothetical protein
MSYLVPYEFTLQKLYPVRPKIKIIGWLWLVPKQQTHYLFKRTRTLMPEFNGVYIATVPEFYEELQKEIHTSRMEFDFDGSKNSWIFISEDLPDFEQKVELACELVKQGDERIGKVS